MSDILSNHLSKIARISILSFILSYSISCGGGGGGGGGAPASTATATSQLNFSVDSQWDVSESEANAYRTTEYNNQWGLEKINAAAAYAILNKNSKTVAGSGTKIAIVDTGVLMTHQEISNNYNASGDYDYINNDNDPSDDSGHGSHVASTTSGVKDGAGIHGVAYDSQIVAFKGLDSNDSGTESSVSNSINAAASSGAKVINLSLGSTSESSLIKTALQNAKTNDVLSVASTGNDGASQPNYPALNAIDSDLQGFVIAVGSVDSSSNISSFSNHCGNAKDYCLVAPGKLIKGAYIGSDSTYALSSGTSMAAPHVSGAAAVIRAAWTHLSASETAQILLQTATDLGDSGTDNIYGRGLLNLEYAVQAQGQNILGYGASAHSQGYDVRQSSIVTDPIFGDAFSNNIAPQLKSAIFLDDFGRDYKANLDQKINSKDYQKHYDLSNRLFNNISQHDIPLTINDKNSLRFNIPYYQNQKAKNYLGLKFITIDHSKQQSLAHNSGLSFQQQTKILNQDFNWGLAFNIDEITNLDNSDNNIGNSLLASNISGFNPFQSFIQNNNQFLPEQQRRFQQAFLNKELFNNNLNVRFSYQNSFDSDSALSNYSNKQNEIIDLGLNYKINSNNKLNISFGNLVEFDNNILNSKSHGAFSSKDNSKTSYLQIALTHQATKDINLTFKYSEGLSKISGNNHGVFRNFSDLRSRSTSLAITHNNLLNGTVGFVYFEPLRIYSGQVNYDIPIARDDAGNLYRKNGYASLKPQGKEQNFEIFYLNKIDSKNNIRFNFLIQKEAGNIKDQPLHYLAAIVLNKKF